MTEPMRMLDGARPPTATEVAAWVGARSFARWTQLAEFIEAEYPGVFAPDWWFGGKKWGWSLRYKKSKSFLNLIPERGQFKALVVFGAEERARVQPMLGELVSHVRRDYDAATTFHDGKWMATVADRAHVVSDLKRLLRMKRKPETAAATGRAPARRRATPAPPRGARRRPARARPASESAR